MDKSVFAYPKVYYFECGNPYTGSYKGMNYKLTPQKDEETGEKSILVSVWYGMFGSAVSEIVAEYTVSMSENGLERSREYLCEQYDIFAKKTLEEEN